MMKLIEIFVLSLKKKFEFIFNLFFNLLMNVLIGFVVFGGGGVLVFAFLKSFDVRAMIDCVRVDMFSVF